jgi:hypothetical protein
MNATDILYSLLGRLLEDDTYDDTYTATLIGLLIFYFLSLTLIVLSLIFINSKL